MRKSSVATMSRSSFLARRQRSQTCRNSGLPAIECRALPGNRVEPHRAGIMPTALLIFLQDNFRSFGDVTRDPIGSAIVLAGAIASLDENRSNTGILPASNIAGFVPDKKRAAQIQPMIALRFKDHSRSRLAPD